MIRGNKLDVLDDHADNLPDAGDIGSYLIDPDGAIVRAGLVQHYAAREGLHQIDPRIAYLTGERIPEGTSGFPFVEKVPLKRLKSVLKSYDAGSLEILVRGVEVDPDQLRKKMKLKGTRPLRSSLRELAHRESPCCVNPEYHRPRIITQHKYIGKVSAQCQLSWLWSNTCRIRGLPSL